tara:strand:- start:26 stop:250 length:225 start_codon:yes stop_codon:yes gene_type:complete
MKPKKENHFDLAAKNLAAQIFVDSVKDRELVARMFNATAEELYEEIAKVALHSCILANQFNKATSMVDRFQEKA